ncbi:NAD+ synthase [Roseovarius nanhaiticus]|uniref:Glutamine-dependent NAD(+) synthetase n=1 Tax=Roseovarius nanhaiticus TaxID=573024 RepID=A0A1N7H2F6_9RHOB|nr:NAD+ synthase [Roseovarius nanhaiticus]SEL15554.1 NAD+ synthase [Roseovarius nanhaiticus]SIS19019.1 NAD+ synthase [Roseovarius nanhaiticus]
MSHRPGTSDTSGTSGRFRLTLAQLNATVGDIKGNIAQVRAAWAEARDAGADMLALPEMFATGYNTQDLVMKPVFHQEAIAAIHALAADCADGPAIAIGGPALEGAELFNAYYVLQGGTVTARVLKHHLPNETVFDEMRLYGSAPVAGPYTVGPVRIGSPICEDAWHEDVAETLAETGAQILLVPNGSPYYRGKMETRQTIMVSRVVETGLPLVYLNLVGGQDDQVFDGGSFVLNPAGGLAVQMPVFETGLAHVDFIQGPEGWRAEAGVLAHIPDQMEQDYHAMVLSLRDYMRKTGFKKVLLGLSGGIDSAIVAVIAADALGAGNVRCVMLPSEYTSQASLDDAQAVAEALGCAYDFVPIDKGRAAITETLAPLFAGHAEDLTEENIQSRLRGLLLMAMSNKFGEMLLTTGNKSEVAVGYSTIYGDMNGGYNPIKDLYKTRVFEMCRWRNATHRAWMMGPEGEVIAPRIIDKPPSAELREDQKDSDSLPDYPVLDAILQILVDGDGSIDDCVKAGFSREDAARVEHLIYISEYKRFQSAPGTRLSKHAFWLDRRYPIANRWRDGAAG